MQAAGGAATRGSRPPRLESSRVDAAGNLSPTVADTGGTFALPYPAHLYTTLTECTIC